MMLDRTTPNENTAIIIDRILTAMASVAIYESPVLAQVVTRLRTLANETREDEPHTRALYEAFATYFIAEAR